MLLDLTSHIHHTWLTQRWRLWLCQVQLWNWIWFWTKVFLWDLRFTQWWLQTVHTVVWIVTPCSTKVPNVSKKNITSIFRINNKPRKNPTEASLTCHMLLFVFCFTYSSSLKVEALCSRARLGYVWNTWHYNPESHTLQGFSCTVFS